MKKTSLRCFKLAALAGAILALPLAAQAQNLLKNGDFSQSTNGEPADWKLMKNLQTVTIDTTETFGGSKQSLRVDIGATGESLGQIGQLVSATPYKKYRLKFDMKSSGPGTGIGSVKAQIGKIELKRVATPKSSTEWKSYSLDVDTGEANVLLVLLRYEQKPTSVGQKVWFANVSLELIGDGEPAPAAQAPVAPTLTPSEPAPAN